MANIPYSVRSVELITKSNEISEPEQLYKAVVELTGDETMARRWQIELINMREKHDIEQGKHDS